MVSAPFRLSFCFSLRNEYARILNGCRETQKKESLRPPFLLELDVVRHVLAEHIISSIALELIALPLSLWLRTIALRSIALPLSLWLRTVVLSLCLRAVPLTLWLSWLSIALALSLVLRTVALSLWLRTVVLSLWLLSLCLWLR